MAQRLHASRVLSLVAAYLIRSFVPDDLRLVFHAWLNDWRTSKYAGCVPNNLYYPTTRTLIEDLIGRGAKILVADSGRSLLGWVCFEEKQGKTVLHYVYTKDAFVTAGVHEALIASISSETPGFMTFFNPKLAKNGWSHCPEMARRRSL